MTFEVFALSRARSPEPYVQQKLTLNATLVARFQLLHWDPVNSKAKYGKMSEVVNKLLADYVNKMEHGVDPLGIPPSETKLESL